MNMKAKHASTALAVVMGTTLLAGALFGCAPAQAASSEGAELDSSDSLNLSVSTPVTATSDQVPAENKHVSRADCATCHDGESNPISAPLSDESCLSCHDQAQLIKATESYEDIANRSMNPHDNHMHGTSCTSCHSNHGESTLACNDCHTNEYDWMVP